ncbi:sporulation protein YqfC [Clostridium tetani]|uniref:Sporulation protein YqfC n=1 Tax=Clostridium tetani TaxID=1513 RepID=A0ABY0EQB2_CLOTA|nr:sporulation protein YqfC [Clostridium tetani]CDI50206.1 sporulation protein YqfC [Clostridium tetani 12124569]AVP55009.1 sporulation protein YqfC [Clostridium tetani]KGI39010.1 sporulation protein [Clostridium tetani]KGI39424.1 sporulation protein [Clostridium tetani ATCC 9441]KGI43579.1 sporulation protein [Clostridium tetani]
MEGKIENAKGELIDKLELPRDVLMDLPKIVITGNTEISIENHRGIVVFDENIVKINSRVGLLSIHGRDFEILFLGGKTITLRGVFKSILYEGSE